MNGGSPELLSLAGTLKTLRYAIAYGADAVNALPHGAKLRTFI